MPFGKLEFFGPNQEHGLAARSGFIRSNRHIVADSAMGSVLIEAFVAKSPVEAFDKAVLHRPAWREIAPLDASVLLPFQYGI